MQHVSRYSAMLANKGKKKNKEKKKEQDELFQVLTIQVCHLK